MTAKFSSFIKEQYRYRPHQLDVSIERALTVREPWASPYPVVEYYVKQLTSSTFLIDQKTLTLEEVHTSPIKQLRCQKKQAECNCLLCRYYRC